MSPFPAHFRYLLVTHIPFARNRDGTVALDGLWARDLNGLAASIGPIRVAAPQLDGQEGLKTWGPTAAVLGADSRICFQGFPPMRSSRDFWSRRKISAILRREVAEADLIHTSNFFPPYVCLSYAHDCAVRMGKKTLLVIAEDFFDMLEWEWVRMAESPFRYRWRRQNLAALDRRVRRSAATASLTFLHTPAAVTRYRLSARNGIAIRQPGYETEDIIDPARFSEKCAQLQSGAALVLVTAGRHKALKGLEFLVGAVSLLARWNRRVELRVYGQGEETGSLRALAHSAGVADRVSFPGSLPPGGEIYRAIAAGHVFVMPHRTTDFGRAFFDAMAGGCPVVAFRTPASIDTVRDGTDGLLAPLDDVEGLAACIQQLDADRALTVRLATAARDRALRNTRSDWFQWRAEWIRALFADPQTADGLQPADGTGDKSAR